MTCDRAEVTYNLQQDKQRTYNMIPVIRYDAEARYGEDERYFCLSRCLCQARVKYFIIVSCCLHYKLGSGLCQYQVIRLSARYKL